MLQHLLTNIPEPVLGEKKRIREGSTRTHSDQNTHLNVDTKLCFNVKRSAITSPGPKYETQIGADDKTIVCIRKWRFDQNLLILIQF